MQQSFGDLLRVEVALRWLLGNPDVHSAIVGTTKLRHLEANVTFAERGGLDKSLLEEIQRRFARPVSAAMPPPR